MAIEAFWQDFLAHTNLDATTKYDSFHFCNDEKLANELLHLVLYQVAIKIPLTARAHSVTYSTHLRAKWY